MENEMKRKFYEQLNANLEKKNNNNWFVNGEK